MNCRCLSNQFISTKIKHTIILVTTVDTFRKEGILKKKKNLAWSSHHGAAETNLIRNHEVVGSIPGLTQWVKDPALL